MSWSKLDHCKNIVNAAGKDSNQNINISPLLISSRSSGSLSLYSEYRKEE